MLLDVNVGAHGFKRHWKPQINSIIIWSAEEELNEIIRLCTEDSFVPILLLF